MPSGTYAKRFTKFDAAGNNYFASEWVDDATLETVSAKTSTTCTFSGGTFSTFLPTGAPGTYQFCYDPFGRPRKVVGSMHSSLQTVSRVDGSAFYSDTLGSVTTGCVNGTFTGGACSGGTDSTVTTRMDAFGRSTSVKEPNGLTTWYGYDVNGKLTSVSQGAQSRSFSYDRAGFLRGETTPEKGTVSYGSIGSLGNVRQVTEPGGLVLSRTFDYAGRLTSVTTNEPRTYLTNTYDEASDGAVSRGSSLGKLTTSTASNYYPSTGYDFAFFPGGKITDSFHYSGVGGRLSLKKTTISNGAVSPVASWTYNNLGLVETENYPRIDPSSTPFAVTTGYTSGLPTAVTANGQQVVTAATYNPAGGLASYTSGNGITTTMTPDPSRLPRPQQISTSNSSFNSGLYSYDGAGNIKSIGADDFTYDSNFRLLSAEYSGTTQNYTYDRWGNLTQKAGTAIPVNAATNHLTAATYDLRGNVVNLAGETYSYDGLNRQARHEAPTSHWSYILDAANERIVKSIPPSDGTNVLRRDMARTILQALGLKPLEECNGTFTDVPCGDPDRGWIERFLELGITGGCEALPNRRFCPDVTLTRAQMAVFLAAALAGPSGVPASGTAFGNPYDCNTATPAVARKTLFGDVPVIPDVAFACSHIHYIYARGITSGCTTGALNFCPGRTTNHREMEVFESVAWPGFAYVPPAATYTFRGAGSSIRTEYQDSTVWKDYVYLGASLVGTRDAGGWKYHTTDHLGSVRLTMSAGGGVESRKYWPWGEEAGTTGAGRLAFAGMELDLEASRPRYYDHARNIETGIGRFLTADMLSGDVADPQSWNRYSYARNNPLKYVDPDGRAPAFAGFVFSAAHGDGYASRAAASLVNTAAALGTAAVAWAGGMAAAGQVGGFGLASASWDSAYVAATNAATSATVAQAGGAAGAGGLVINAASRWTDLAPRAAEILTPVQLARVGKVVEISHNWVVRNTLNGIPDAGHLTKIENGLRGLNTARTSLELSLRNPNLSPEARDLMNQALNRATELINRAEVLIHQ